MPIEAVLSTAHMENLVSSTVKTSMIRRMRQNDTSFIGLHVGVYHMALHMHATRLGSSPPTILQILLNLAILLQNIHS